MKNKWRFIGITGVLFGTILSRWATNYYGEAGSLVVGVIAFIILVGYFFAMAYKTKKYLIVILLSILFFTLVIGLIGLTLGNIYIGIGGLILFFVLAVLMTKKIFPWLQNRK